MSLYLDIILDISLHLGNHIIFIFKAITFYSFSSNHIVFIFKAITFYSFSSNHIVFIFIRINGHFPKLPSNHIVFIFKQSRCIHFQGNHIVFIFKQSHCIHFQPNNNQVKYHFIRFDSILFLNSQAITFQTTAITFLVKLNIK
jgi:hypothetical protein